LLELARVMDVPRSGKTIYLAFFDAEDNGRLGEWNWIVGSTYMAQHWGENGESPLQNVIVVDMVGDKDLNIYMDRYSDRTLTNAIWHTAEKLGYADKFIPEIKYAMLDDHIPFARLDIPAIDIIDFDYPYWHTTQDTPDKVSAESLQIVGTTLETWLESQTQQ
jgi:glutaminyl-peptide cyclotransferase